MFQHWTYEDELLLHENISRVLLIQSFFIFFALYMFIPAPWGKTISYSFGPLLPARVSWCIFESPNLVWSYICWTASNRQQPLANRILLTLFVLHYMQRAILYPLHMSKSTTGMPLAVVASAFTFCSFNGYLQGQNLCLFTLLPDRWHWHPQFVVGLCIFAIGAAVNLSSDAALRRLREVATPKQQQKKYSIPYGGLFEYVSAPHFFGEIVEWAGFCVACNFSLATVSFFVYTAANLIPRGVAHHAWYQKTFKSTYPANRKAVVPFLW